MDILETIGMETGTVIVKMYSEAAIRDSLAEKEVLLKEIHHRVKNNMQIISSLLNLQLQHVQEEEASNVLIESQGRVKTMAMIHEKLYQSPDLTRIRSEITFKSWLMISYTPTVLRPGALNWKWILITLNWAWKLPSPVA